MPQAIVNPEELLRFAGSLRQFNAQLGESSSQLIGQFNQLGDTWRDQEHQKFAQQFQETMVSIRRFMQAADEQIPFLLRKADAARAYLERR